VFLLLSPALAALVVAALANRSLAALTRHRIAAWPLGLAAFGLELALTSTPLGRHPFGLTWGSPLWVGALLSMALVLARNAWVSPRGVRWAWSLAAIGVLLNVAVVVANDGHMPQSQQARIAAGASAERVAGLAAEPGWRNVAPMTDQSRLAWLGDVVPEPAWLPLHNVMSLGDVLLASGIAAVLFLATTPRSREVPAGASTTPMARTTYASREQRDVQSAILSSR
jgi:hypothetical protein